MGTELNFDWSQAATVIEERGWIKNAMENEHGVCLTGALKICSPQPGDWLISRAVARHRGHGESWNDSLLGKDGKTEVLNWLRTADPITDDELAIVFGTQWLHIVALIRRASSLSGDEISALDAASSAAWGDALGAALDAASDAALDAAWGAALDAAWGAASDAALDAAWGAVALVVRDLIGKHGFTQKHYDALSRPWRTVIGKLHPDDEEKK